MQRPSDERLIAYLDNEVEESERVEITAWLERDAELRERAARLSESAALLRSAFDETLHEPLPERLVAAARGQTAEVVDLATARQRRWTRHFGDRRWWIGVPVAASLLGLFVGTGVGYFAANQPGLGGSQTVANANVGAGNWLDNIAGYHKLFVAAGSGNAGLVDIPAGDNGDGTHKVAQKLPSDIHLPNLKPWGLSFQGARLLFIEGQPATQLFYTTDNKALGPLTLVIGNSSKGDLAPTFDHRDDVNLLYWRHHGHAYALVGTANIGYLWNLANDIAYQLDAI
jgi:anti-sigma factor RsiW